MVDKQLKMVYNYIEQRKEREMYPNIKYEMFKQNITQKDLAEIVGIHENTLRRNINGDTPMTVETLKKICIALKKSPLYLWDTGHTDEVTQ